MPPPPPRLTLFPYTTLFRSAASSVTRVLRERPGAPGGQVDLALGNRQQVVLRLVEEPAVCLRGLPVVVHDAVPQARARKVEPARQLAVQLAAALVQDVLEVDRGRHVRGVDDQRPVRRLRRAAAAI